MADVPSGKDQTLEPPAIKILYIVYCRSYRRKLVTLNTPSLSNNFCADRVEIFLGGVGLKLGIDEGSPESRQ